MHRKPLLSMLQHYAAQYPDEAAVVDRVEQFVRCHADCFERSCRPGHITCSAWVLSPDRRRCLLVHHRRLNRWIQPGGHADGETNLAEVARREVQQETGLRELEMVCSDAILLPLDIDVHQIPARLDANGEQLEDAHQHHDIRFLLVAAEGQALRCSDESHDVRWFTRDEVLQATDEKSVLRMLYKAGPE